MIKTKSKSTNKPKCINCLEERKKADRSRKYAHELKNIFITISTVVNSEMESPHQIFTSFSNNTSHVAEGDVSPFLMETKKHRIQSKQNSITNVESNNADSPFYFLKTLCDYGKTLIKEINDMGKDYTNNEKSVEPFNIAKAIDFCVDMFDTKRKYDKAKKNLEIFSDINFSYDKVIKSISETGFKMVLINLLTNSYKFTIKGKIIVRAVSMPKEKKIRILVKDSGKGFNMKEFKKNGCFYIFEKNQELNADGSGLGLTIVNEILTKFNIKLDCISNTEKGGSLFFFDLDDSYPYYDEINPNDLMTDSLTQILKDINSGKKDKEYIIPKDSFNLLDHLVYMNSNNNLIEVKKENENEKNSIIVSNKNLNINNINNNNLRVNIKFSNKQRFSFMNITNDANCSPKFGNRALDKSASLKPTLDIFQKNSKNINENNNNSNLSNSVNIVSNDKGSNQNSKCIDKSDENKTFIVASNSNNNNNIISTPYKKKIDRFFSLQKQMSIKNQSNKKEDKSGFLKQVVGDYKRFNKLKTFNYNGKKTKENKNKSYFKKYSEDNLIENDYDDEEYYKKIKNEKQKKNYKKLLDRNFNKSKFYLFDLRKLFKKNEIYIQLNIQKNKRCITEPSSEGGSARKLKSTKSVCINPKKVYIIICDDELFVAKSAKELIINYYTKKGKEPHVYFTPNGIECLYLIYKLFFIENRKIEYILMDLEMPYLNGIKTCNIIKSIKEVNIRVFILSGDEPSDCEADGYCNKPLNEIDIINKLDK